MELDDFDILKFKGKTLGTLQISGVGDKVVPLVREVVRPLMKSSECLCIHFKKNITHKGAFSKEIAETLIRAINEPLEKSRGIFLFLSAC